MGCGGSNEKDKTSGARAQEQQAPPPAAPPAMRSSADRFKSCPDVLQYGMCNDFDAWKALFQEHTDDKSIGYTEQTGPEFKLPFSRNQCVEEISTQVYRGMDHPNELLLWLRKVRMDNFLDVAEHPNYTKHIEDRMALQLTTHEVLQEVSDGCVLLRHSVQDPDAWLAAFKQQADARAQYCDDSQTKVYKSVDDNKVAVLLCGVDAAKLKEHVRSTEYIKWAAQVGQSPGCVAQGLGAAPTREAATAAPVVS
eukprot:TRINITY_DN7945_c0_g1_i7.p1 TRINITY_DN7945_c0_g1~~TRINITY_DN7945_c0_g1_i7.p1  ORF type:complete len:252 (+),score=88.30 TRINITY_DN7945_c0_g1_i7:182-937(+)